MVVQQLLREWPPGFGGIERVAHELATFWGGDVYSLDVQGMAAASLDPLEVSYSRKRLGSFRLLGRCYLPLPYLSLVRLLFSSTPLHGHLPSPAVLILLLIARFIRPHRQVTAHWHCFLEPTLDLNGRFFAFYQWLALSALRFLTAVVTTSPQLSSELQRNGCSSSKIFVVPCCLALSQEQSLLRLQFPTIMDDSPLKILFIGRLDSYKRLDLLLKSLVSVSVDWQLSVVGDGPKRIFFEKLSMQLFCDQITDKPDLIRFHGRLSEAQKIELIAASDVLVLPSVRSNEAFGIVQLEAMAAGRLSLAFTHPKSGMGWVGQVPSLSWSQSPYDLSGVLQRLGEDPIHRLQLCKESRDRYLRLFSRSVWCNYVKHFGESATLVNPVDVID